MEDITIDQVKQIISQFYPENQDQVLQEFENVKNEMGLNNMQTVLFIEELLKREKSKGGRFGSLKNMLGR